MDTNILLVFIVILILIIYSLIIYIRKRKAERNLEELKSYYEKNIESIEKEFEEKQNQIMIEHKKVMDEKTKQRQDLNIQIENLEKHSTNPGEISTHNFLIDMKKKLIRLGYIRYNEMVVMANIFVPTIDKKTDVHYLRQIDHLVILPTRVYVIETKHWRGNVFHGINYNNAKELKFILKAAYKDYKSNKNRTIVFITSKDDNNNTIMQIRDYNDPSKQARSASGALWKFLTDNTNIKIDRVEPILHFAYKENPPTDFTKVFTKKEFTNMNSEHDTYTSTNEKDLLHIFTNELLHRKRQFNSSEIEQIEKTVREYNHHLD